MAVQPYLYFNGNCREAVNYYADIFGTEEPKILLFGDMPANEDFPLTDEAKDQVLHAEIVIKGTTIMFSDTAKGMPFVVGNNIILTFSSTDMEEIKSAFDKLKTEGKVIMELGETFWSKCYGYLVDKFGIGWQLSLEDHRQQ